MNLREKRWYKNAWSYFTGAILLSLLQILTLIITGEPWSISSTLTNWGAWILNVFGLDVSNWTYFQLDDNLSVLEAGFLRDPKSLRNLGIIVGALISSLMASQFKFRKTKSSKQVILAALGGFLMGYGSRIASGCNIGALYSGISSLSLSGWVFALFVFLGAIIGSKIIMKFLL